MIPASRVMVVRNADGRVEAHVAKARKPGFYIVDRYADGTWNCTCWAAMHLDKATCDHREVVQLMVATTAGAA